MFNLKGSLEDQIKANERLLKELEVRDEALRKEFATVFAQYDLTPDDVADFVSCRDNFSDEEWVDVEIERAALEKALADRMKQVHDVRSSRDARANLRIDQQWLPCR